MTLPPDLDAMTHEDMKSLNLALFEKIDELEARLNEPPKGPGNSSVPSSKTSKANESKGNGKSERTGPHEGSVGRKGGGRPLAQEPDETSRQRPTLL